MVQSVRQEVAGELMQRNFVDAIVAEKIKPCRSSTHSLLKAMKMVKHLEFEATFEVYPEVVLKDLDKIAVERPSC